MRRGRSSSPRSRSLLLSLLPLLAPSPLLAKSAAARGKHASPPAEKTNGGPCSDGDEAALWWSPQTPIAGGAIKVLAVGDGAAAGDLAVVDPDGHHRTLTVARHPGSPGSLSAELAAPHAGAYRLTWTRGDRVACRDIEVA
ncbi:MAG TPA: hypothetical protein VKO16_05950, partial [Polyangia bacterium]|nr:hypothetical protein [Polyangia bacterium]